VPHDDLVIGNDSIVFVWNTSQLARRMWWIEMICCQYHQKEHGVYFVVLVLEVLGRK